MRDFSSPLLKKSTFFLYSWSTGDADDSLLRAACGEYELPFTSGDAGDLDLGDRLQKAGLISLRVMNGGVTQIKGPSTYSQLP